MAPSVKQTNSALANRLVLQGLPPSFISFAAPLPDTNGPANATPLVLAAQAPGGGGLHGRGQRLLYAYDAVGNLTNVDYPTSPDITLSYDALDRVTNMVDAVGTTHYTYTAASQILTEDGPWNNDTVTYNYVAQQRTGMSLEQPSALTWLQTYDYDEAKRLKSTTSPAGEFDYDYDALRSLQVRKLQLPGGSVITNDFDANARLTGTWLRNSSGANLDSVEYIYNHGNERTKVTRADGSYVDYTYDPIGQLRTALGSEAGGVTARLNEQFKYGYDAAHNLQARTNNALEQNFGVNNLNELTTVTRNTTHALTVAGTTSSQATSVTVNGLSAALYGDYTFAKAGFTPADGLNTYTAIAHDALGRWDTNTLTVQLPAATSFIYDLNGNLLSDGRRTFDYNDENQLLRVTVTNAWSGESWKSEFVYDGKMRRRIREEYVWQSGAWSKTGEVHYVYDGNLVIQERDASNLPQVTYTRGKDLSGSLEGAGGIGGLLARSEMGSLPPGLATPHAYYHADGNGNITALVNNLQLIVAKYLYDPFGNTLSLSGPLAEANLYRFSSKEFHPASSLIYHLYRYYEPGLQRWLNRDPLGEPGFESVRQLHRSHAMFASLNVYGFVHNQPISHYDPKGLSAECDEAQAKATAAAEAMMAAPSEEAYFNFLVLQGIADVVCNPPPPPPMYPVCVTPGQRTDFGPGNPNNQTFCQRHPNVCLGGEIVAVTGIVVGTGILIIGTGGAAAPVLIVAL